MSIILLVALCAFAVAGAGAGPIPLMSLEHMDPTLPPALLPGQTPPKCSLLVLEQDFADTVGAPPASANYSQPPDCPAPWTRVVLELSISASDSQKSRVAAVWVDGAEVLRTSTPLPTSPGAFWTVQKDVTRYTAAFRRLSRSASGGAISMMLENSNTRLPGVFSANVTLHFYRGGALSQQVTPPSRGGSPAHPTIRGLYHHPADMIIPVIKANGYYGSGFWFKIMNETHVETAAVAVPRNTYRAVLEIFASYHADDVSWYTNPLRSSYIRQPPPPAAAQAGRANGGFRQVYATIDGKFVGGQVPFPVIYPGAVNPFFWSPISAIGAFDMPSYDLDVTPFLGLLLDGFPHEIGLGVRDAQQYWLLSANLHVWTDEWSDATTAGLIEYNAPPLKMNRHAEWRSLEGQSEVDAEGLLRFRGWVSSSHGNLTTTVQQKLKFKSQVEVQNRGAVKQIEVSSKGRTTVGISKAHQLLGRVQVLVEAPLQMQTTTVNAAGGAVFQKTRLYHQLQETEMLNEGQSVVTSQLTDRQDAEGSALMHDGEPVWGSGLTKSTYKYRDEGTCYLRTVNSGGGIVMVDTKSASCSAAAVADA